METPHPTMLSQQELAKRWSRSVSAIGLVSALGVGPRYIKSGGQLQYPLEDIQRYERACLFFDPADLAFCSAARQ